MATILGISGSLRAGSYNTKLLHAARALVPAGSTISLGTIEGIPLYNADVEASEGLPAAVTALKDQMSSADGVLLVTPEYNNGIPGVFKNAIDWLSRPPRDIPKVFGGRPFGVIGASAGEGGTTLSQTAWLQVLKTLGTVPFFGERLAVKTAGNVFDADGNIIDVKVKERLERYIAGFASFVGRFKKE
jgi:NAD(P)H-dependent FMN reductase